MADEHWERVKALYETAAARPARERAQFLAEACADEELRREVQALLDQPVSTGRLMHVLAAAPEAVAEFVRSADLLVGRRIGSYEVRALVGRGGMGEVYCARDTKLGRDVAIKVLPRAFTADPDRLARFEREARVLAALNHPNIAIIHGIEDDADGVRALVLELVEGETLADRIARGRLALIEALTIARQLVGALDAAHEKGIVHRDLKPANIKITPDGAVKVLDFGLAKAVAGDHASPDLTQSPTVTAGGTSQGIILGTPAYMSPEQARGQTIDKRTDIWAFGCVLYEMLTGRAAFPGHTVSDTIAAILEREPDWQTLPARTPPPVRRLLSSCVEKEPKRRLRDIGDARIDLEDALAGRPLGVPQPAGVTRRTAMSALAGATVGAAATGVFAISRYRGATPGRLTRFAIAAPAGDSFVASFGRRIAVSPDGTHLAYVAANPTQNNRLYLRSLSDLEPRLLLEGGGQQFFSPDGGRIGFVDVPTAQLRKIGLTAGGAPVTVCRGFTAGGSGGTWADGDIIYFIGETPGSLLRVAAAGGQPDEAAKLDFANGERVYKFPCALPGGNAILLTVATADTESFDDAHIVVFVPATGQKKVLVEGGTHPRYSPSGHLVYARNGNLLAVSFDPNQLVATGQPFTVLEGVLMSRNTGVANFDVSVNGDLAYLPGRAEGGARSLVWVNRDGTAEKLPLPPRSYLRPRISPDSHKLAIEIEGSNHDIYVYDFASGVLSNITTNGVSHWPVWSPDGHAIGYRSGPMGAFKLWQVPADRSHAPRQLQAEGVSQSVESYSPDGRVIAYTAMGPGAPSRIMLASTQGNESARPMDNTKYVQGSAKFSPDGRWLAFCSNESKTPQVYVQAFPGPGPKIQVSTDGGTDPVWKRSGEEIFYRKGDSMMVVPVSTAPSFTHGRPKELWKGHYSHGMSSSCGPPGATSSNYDVTADGQRFLMIKDDDQDSATSTQIVVVLGWADELSRSSTRT